MAGLLTHLGAGFAGFLLILLLFYKFKLVNRLIIGISFLIGNIAPDLVDFGYLIIRTGTFDTRKIMMNPLFYTLANLGHSFSNWLIVAVVMVFLFFLLFELKKISKVTLITVILAVVLFLVGVLIHFRLDVLIQEVNHWI